MLYKRNNVINNVFINCSLQMRYSTGEPLLETMVRDKKQLTSMTQKVKEHLKEAH